MIGLENHSRKTKAQCSETQETCVLSVVSLFLVKNKEKKVHFSEVPLIYLKHWKPSHSRAANNGVAIIKHCDDKK